MSSDIAFAVDRAQDAGAGGPRLDPLATSQPASVPHLTTTVVWPGFREAAAGLGLHGSLSLPIFAGSGFAIAALSLYARVPEALKPLASAVNAVFDDYCQPGAPDVTSPLLDAGGRQLVGGLVAALHTHERIQTAIGILMEDEQASRTVAYTRLREQAAIAGDSLVDAADKLLDRK